MDAFTSIDGTSGDVVKFEAVFGTEASIQNMSYEKQVSSVMTNLRALHEEVHQAVTEQNQDRALKAIDKMSYEIAKLSRFSTELEAYRHSVLSTQEENHKFELQAAIQETMRTSFAEIEAYQRKLSLQNDVILGQQKAFNDYRANSSAKLIEMGEASEKVSRLTLDRGLLKSELHKCHSKVRELQADAEKSSRGQESSSATIASLLASKFDLEKAIASLRTESVNRAKEIDRVSDLYDGQLERYKLQAREFGNVHQDWTIAKTEVKALKSEIEAQKGAEAELRSKLQQLELEQEEALKSENGAREGVEAELRAKIQQFELKMSQVLRAETEWSEKETKWTEKEAGLNELIEEVLARNKVLRKANKQAASENAVLNARVQLMQAEASHAETEDTAEQSLMDMDDAAWVAYQSLANGSASVTASATP
ncbi:hypothetical protein BU16DRAFT_521330 [Lophium mytilinum]|uniref:Uncharacterized protein n=1 Tax=Lophium mytilinum TaxID=390894 RepID=A0A6A6RCK9_9PEZI|nr:hypothetical protein BU16DRAFT_521330 [Lophium mytilinum]